jgi:hypothetical protein
LFTDDRSEVYFVGSWVQGIDVRIVGLFVIRVDEDDVLLRRDVRGRVGQAATTRHNDVPFEAAMPVVASGAGGGKPSRDVQRTRWFGVFLLPDGIIRREQGVDGDAVVLEGANVKGQHSRENYQREDRLTSE